VKAKEPLEGRHGRLYTIPTMTIFRCLILPACILLAGCAGERPVVPADGALVKQDKKFTARQYPDDSRPESLFGHAEATSRPNIVFIDNRLPAFRSFKKAYYQVENVTDKLHVLSILVSMHQNDLKLEEIKKYKPDNDENITRGMLLMNEWAEEARKLTAELHRVLGE
jgi:hypothetical protein